MKGVLGQGREGAYPLGGVRVLDMTEGDAGFCSRLLAGLGARVIKIESPEGDPTRRTGPFRGGVEDPEKSLSFWHNNAGKLGITLDLKKGGARGVFVRLAARTEVLVESFPPGHLEGLGLGFHPVREMNPGLVWISVTPFGRGGPRSGHLSCDLVSAAFGGQMYVSGTAERPPLKGFRGLPGYTASLYAAIGGLLGLRAKKRGHMAVHVDISRQEAVSATLDHVLAGYAHDGVVAERPGHRSFAVLPCSDGFIMASLFRDWPTLVEWAASEGGAGDLGQGEWDSEEYRMKNRDHVIEVLSRWTRTHTRSELFEKAQALGFPWAPVCSPGEVTGCPHLRARRFFVPTAMQGRESVELPRLPFLSDMPGPGSWRGAPSLGEHNLMVYHQELGFSLEEIENLSACGVI